MPDYDDGRPPEDESTIRISPPDGEPEHIGPYKILQKLGEGGMGVVYLAEQTEPIRRRVALKLIKLGMDSKQVIARFEAERQALALMNHPNVAKVFDAGTTEQGRPYFAMEYVKGESITKYCDKHRLTTGERLRLFMQACDGVQHAHQKGIIHRDIKPTNVLVSVEGDKPIPKIIDFGVAKATEHRLTEKTVFTHMGALIGTAEYMSPEQAEMTTLDIDTRTDVYSLGVLLYELLVGALPFDPRELRQAGFDEVRRMIREEEPSRPSTRISTLSEASRESARHRGTDPGHLAGELRGDLDRITMKALEKDRTRRYRSARDLAEDIGRQMRNEPILARAPSTIYRAGKFAKRHRTGLVTGIVALLAVVVITALGISLRRLGSRDELGRIRSTMEQVVTTGRRAASVDPEWSSLKERLLDHFRQHGGLIEHTVAGHTFGRLLITSDELGNMVRRASAQLELDVASFGLISDPPAVRFNTPKDVLDLYDPYTSLVESYIADIEVSWDGGEWKLIKVHTAPLTGGLGFDLALADVAGTTALPVGPHSLEARVTFSFLSNISEGERDRLQINSVWDGPGYEWLPKHERPESVFRETRSLGVFEINLFHKYPADFPRAIPWDPDHGPLASWLAVEKIQIVRADLPDDEPRGGFSASFEGSIFGISTPFPLDSRDNWICFVTLFGRFREDIPLPIAFMASVSLLDTPQRLVSFPFVLGDGRLGGRRVATRDDTGFTSVSYAYEPSRRLVEPSEDGIYPGLVRLVPSREVALGSKRFQRYLGDQVSLAIPVEVVTVEAEWGESDLPGACVQTRLAVMREEPNAEVLKLLRDCIRQQLPTIINKGADADQFENLIRQEFAPLNGDPEFEAIVAEVKRRLGEE